MAMGIWYSPSLGFKFGAYVGCLGKPYTQVGLPILSCNGGVLSLLRLPSLLLQFLALLPNLS